MAGLAPTVRDADRLGLEYAALAPTRRPPSSGAGATDTDPHGPLTELPDELSGYQLMCWLDVDGTGEVERVALVRNPLRRRRIVKFYRPGITLDPGVHDAWRTVRHQGVVRLYEAGAAAGRAFEVMADVGDRVGGDCAPPSARRTTLRDLLVDHPGGLRPAQVVDLVRQLGQALAAIGGAGIAHLDVRPENILLARRTAAAGQGEGDEDPQWDATLVDFGLAAHLATRTMWDVARPFSGYTAPELLSNSVSAATDWWSLGIMVAELAAGGHPLLRLDPRNVKRQLSTSNVPPPAGLTERVRMLYGGLTAPLGDRWGADEVASWAVGGAPVAPRRRQAAHRTAFGFRGEEFRHLPQLVAALQQNWAEAADVLFGPDADRWDELCAWLPQFDRAGLAAREIIGQVERLGGGADPWSADARLLVLLRQADPSLTPRLYRSVRVDRETVAGIARVAHPVLDDLTQDDGTEDGCAGVDPEALQGSGAAGSAPLRELVDDLWRWRLLAELDGAAGGRGLAEVDELWRALDQRWSLLMGVLRDTGATLFRHIADEAETPPRVHLLRVASDRAFRSYLRLDLDRTRAFVGSTLGGHLPAFEEFAAAVLPQPTRRGSRGRVSSVETAPPDVGELVGLLALHLVGVAVRIEAEDERDRRDRAAREQRARSVAWRRRERWRMIERPVAMGWAAGAMGVVLVAWAGLLIAADAVPPLGWLRPPSDDAIALAWSFVVVCVAAQTACELWLAASVGAPYHRDYSLSTIFLRAAGASGRRWGQGLWTATVVLVVVLAASAAVVVGLLVAPYLLPVPVVVAHVRSARRRYRRWVADHARLRTQFA